MLLGTSILRRIAPAATAFCLLPSTGGAVAADGSATTLPPLVVTATRIATPVSAVGSSVTVITAEDIEAKGYRTLPDALRTVPGLSVRQSGGTGAQTSVFIRGANSNHTLFLLNGMNVNNPSNSNGVFDPSQLTLDNVERIEVIRGPQSVLYGSDAIGGVINIITKDAATTPSATLTAEGGSLGTYRVGASAEGGRGPVSARVDVSRVSTPGDNIAPGGLEDDGHQNTTVSGRLSVQAADNLDLDLFAQRLWSKTDVDGFFVDDPTSRNDREQLYLQGTADATLFDGLWEMHVRIGVSDQELTSRAFTTSTFDGRIYDAGVQNDFRLSDTGTLTVGIEGEVHEATVSSAAFSGSNSIISGFAQYQFEYWDDLSGTVGARIDHHDSFGTEPTYRVALAYTQPRTGTILRGTVATGFNAPSLTDQFGFFPGFPGVFDDFVGNPDLEPEKSFSWDIGVEQPLFGSQVIVGATFFRNRLTNLIAVPPGTDFNDGVPDRVENIASALSYGLESFVRWYPVEWLDLAATHTFTRTEDRTNGGPLLRRPEQLLNIDVTVRPLDTVMLGATIQYVGEQADFSGTVDDYVTIDLTGEYRVSERLSLFARAANLMDVRVEDPLGFEKTGLEIFAGARFRLQ